MAASSNPYDPWYATAAFGVLLCVIVGAPVALYSDATNTLLAQLLDAVS